MSNKVIIVVVIFFIILGGIYLGVKKTQDSKQVQTPVQVKNAMYQNQQQQISPVISQTTMSSNDEQAALQQDLTDDQSLNQISQDDITDDSVLSDTSGL